MIIAEWKGYGMLYSIVIACRNLSPEGGVERLIRENVTKLVSMTGPPMTCRVNIERTRRFRNGGNPFHIMIRVMIPGNGELSVERFPSGIRMNEPLSTALLNAFAIIRRKIADPEDAGEPCFSRRPNMEYGAVVVRLSREDGWGYLKTISGREIFFSRESVHDGGFDRMAPGTGVWFIEKEGVKGPWASYVRIIDPSV